MKTFKALMLAILMAALCSIPVGISEAAAAPPLTAVSAFAIGSEKTPEVLVPTAYPARVDTAFAGSNIALRLKYTGYPNWNNIFVRVNGSLANWQTINRVMINNPATGYFHNILIPFSEFNRKGENSIEVTVQGQRGSSYTAWVTGIKIK